MALLDEYLMPGEVPQLNPDLDPRDMERLKYLSLFRSGMGMLGREPLGSAVQGGINTYATGMEEARRVAQTRMQMALQQYKAQEQYKDAMRKAMFIKNLDEDTLRAAGIPQVMIDTIKGSGDPAEATLRFIKFFESKTAKPGDVEMNWTGTPKYQIPRESGEVVGVGPNGEPTIGLAPGALTSQVQRTLAGERAKGVARAETTLGEYPVPGRPGIKEMKREIDVLNELTPQGTSAPPAAAPAPQPNATAKGSALQVSILTEEAKKEAALLEAARQGKDVDGNPFASPAAQSTAVALHEKNLRQISEGLGKYGGIAEKYPVAPAAKPGERLIYPPAPANYAYTAKGDLKPIEGGPSDLTTFNIDKMRTALQKADLVEQQIATAKKQIKPWTTGVPAAILGEKSKYFTPMHDLRNTLDTIRSNIGFGLLMEMRAQSPQGASGLGQLAVYELDQLQKSLSSLDQTQSDTQLRDNLDKVMKHYNNAREAIMKQHSVLAKDFPTSTEKSTMPRGATGSWDREDPLDYYKRGR